MLSLTEQALSYFDMQVGMNYAYFPTDDLYVNGGFSVQHINRAKESFFTNTSGYDDRISPRYIGFLNASFKLNDLVIVNPMAYYTRRQNHLNWLVEQDFNIIYQAMEKRNC